MAKRKSKTVKEEERLRQDKERLQKAIVKHEKRVNKPLKEFRDYYRGLQWKIGNRAKFNDEIVDNIVYGIVSSQVSSLYLGDVKTKVRPKQSTVIVNGKSTDAFVGATRHQILADFLYEELDVESTMELVLTDALLGFGGVVFTGFEAKTRELEDVEIGESLDESNDAFNEIIESESLFADRISPKDFIRDVDVMDPNLKDSKRVMVHWVKTPEEVREEFKKTDVLPNGEITNPEADARFSTFKRGLRQTPDKDVWARIEGYDIWDKENQEIRTVVMDHPRYLQKKPWPLDYKGEFPFDILWFNYMPDSAIPLADTELYKGRQDYINMIHSKIVDHVKKLADQKYAYNQSKVKRNDAEKFARGPSGSTLPVKGNPKDAWDAQNDGGASQDFYAGIQKTKGDVLGMLGISQFEAGGTTDFNSASEAKQEQAGTLPKRAFRSKKFKKFLVRVIKKLSNVASQVLPTTEIPLNDNVFEDLVKNQPQLLNGRNTNQLDPKTRQPLIEVFPFTTIDKELLSGEYQFDVNIVDTGPESIVTNKENALALMKVAETNPLINKAEATKIFLRAFMFDHLNDRLLRNPDEVAKEQAAATQAQIQAQIAVDAPKRETDLEKTKMKVMDSLVGKGMELDSRNIDSERRFVIDQSKIESSERISAIDKLFNRARSNGGTK